MSKTCIKCGISKPVADFYSRSYGRSGVQGKCKECTKAAVAERALKKSKDLLWVLAERERCRNKTRSARTLGKMPTPTTDQKREINRNYRDKYPEKYRAHIICQRLPKKPCEVCGSANSQRHHHDYSKPLSVRYFCPKHHSEHHSLIRGIETAEAMILCQPAEGIAYATPHT